MPRRRFGTDGRPLDDGMGRAERPKRGNRKCPEPMPHVRFRPSRLPSPLCPCASLSDRFRCAFGRLRFVCGGFGVRILVSRVVDCEGRRGDACGEVVIAKGGAVTLLGSDGGEW